jgi:hypothetical protein
MAVSRNPDETPQADPAQDEEARLAGLKRIQIVCDTPDDEPDDADTPPISFYAYTDFIPRKGEILILQDGKRVQVQDLYYRIGTVGRSKLMALIPFVYATLDQTGETAEGSDT